MSYFSYIHNLTIKLCNFNCILNVASCTYFSLLGQRTFNVHNHFVGKNTNSYFIHYVFLGKTSFLFRHQRRFNLNPSGIRLNMVS